ncbi:MAG: hypothetical protein NC417_01365 [Candidatus Gastranaerophilales bacterium]|nr:hypothetical protein [Candidatus Gastranaerophilales bacterium]
MKIRAITMNAANMAVQQNTQRNQYQAQSAGSMFSPRYKVSISKEGRDLIRQQSSHAGENAQSAQSISTQRKLFRQQDQDELQEDIRQGYHAELRDIEEEIKEANRAALNSDNLDQRTQDLINVMNSQRDRQAEETERRLKEAREWAMQAAGYQEGIEENNRDLVMLLRTMEEAEKAEEERENGKARVENDDSAPDFGMPINKFIKGSATQFVTSSLKRESLVMDGYANEKQAGHRFIRMADQITQNVIAGAERVKDSFDEENYTDEEIAKEMSAYRRGIGKSDKDVEDIRKEGQLILHDATIEKLVHIKNNPLGGLLAAKQSMMLTAADSTVNQTVNNHLVEGSGEIAEEAQKLLHERHSLDRIRQSREEQKEDQEEVKEEKAKEEQVKEEEAKEKEVSEEVKEEKAEEKEVKQEREKRLSENIQTEGIQTEGIQAATIQAEGILAASDAM